MKDYSQYFKNRYSFIKKYTIGEDGKIYFYTPDTKESHPNVYDATPDMALKLEDRLLKQYQLVIENKDIIINDKTKKVRRIIYSLALIGLAFLIVLWFLQGPLIITSSIFIASVLGIAGGEIAISLGKIRFEEELRLYQGYIHEHHKMESLSKQDENITSHLNDKTRELLNRNEKLKHQGLIKNIYNIDLMDKMALEEIRELLLRCKISESLDSEPIFIIPKEQRAKARKKVKNLDNKQI